MTKYKKPQKSARLLFAEGREDRAWFNALVAMYGESGGAYSLVIDQGNGGSADGIVASAVKKQVFLGRIYDQILVVVDGDKPEDELQRAKALAVKNGLELIIIPPCMEAMQLNILEPNKGWYKKTSGHKHYFEANYVNDGKRNQAVHYTKILTKAKVDIALENKSDPLLEVIIGFIAGK